MVVDSSAYPDRFNKFQVTEKSSPDPLAGEVTLISEGTYEYFIHEQEDSNLDPDLTGNLLEQGILKVVAVKDTLVLPGTTDKTYKVYE